ncbi:hypothetical protein FNV43_RR11131 [Rhamnella rubrinervis]|uniref:RNase H type-1 domain-containing protein n=1 Tax=Rhamnella rubrinervis TaxID=2594499 RepID=A0A8K0MGY8_9ROSA|nr:hypothetical protein FNV43_RR11131 [Rhamnella rubrinervis]
MDFCFPYFGCVSILLTEEQIIYVDIPKVEGRQVISFVYGSVFPGCRKNLCVPLENFTGSIDHSWVVMKDFNVILVQTIIGTKRFTEERLAEEAAAKVLLDEALLFRETMLRDYARRELDGQISSYYVGKLVRILSTMASPPVWVKLRLDDANSVGSLFQNAMAIFLRSQVFNLWTTVIKFRGYWYCASDFSDYSCGLVSPADWVVEGVIIAIKCARDFEWNHLWMECDSTSVAKLLIRREVAVPRAYKAKNFHQSCLYRPKVEDRTGPIKFKVQERSDLLDKIRRAELTRVEIRMVAQFGQTRGNLERELVFGLLGSDMEGAKRQPYLMARDKFSIRI